jgi:hypothetical protein
MIDSRLPMFPAQDLDSPSKKQINVLVKKRPSDSV